MNDLPKCPTCGRTVEFHARETNWSGNAEIRCVGHHRLGMSFGPGAKSLARKMLIEQWLNLSAEGGKENQTAGAEDINKEDKNG